MRAGPQEQPHSSVTPSQPSRQGSVGGVEGEAATTTTPSHGARAANRYASAGGCSGGAAHEDRDGATPPPVPSASGLSGAAHWGVAQAAGSGDGSAGTRGLVRCGGSLREGASRGRQQAAPAAAAGKAPSTAYTSLLRKPSPAPTSVPRPASAQAAAHSGKVHPPLAAAATTAAGRPATTGAAARAGRRTHSPQRSNSGAEGALRVGSFAKGRSPLGLGQAVATDGAVCVVQRAPPAGLVKAGSGALAWTPKALGSAAGVAPQGEVSMTSELSLMELGAERSASTSGGSCGGGGSSRERGRYAPNVAQSQHTATTTHQPQQLVSRPASAAGGRTGQSACVAAAAAAALAAAQQRTHAPPCQSYMRPTAASNAAAAASRSRIPHATPSPPVVHNRSRTPTPSYGGGSSVGGSTHLQQQHSEGRVASRLPSCRLRAGSTGGAGVGAATTAAATPTSGAAAARRGGTWVPGRPAAPRGSSGGGGSSATTHAPGSSVPAHPPPVAGSRHSTPLGHARPVVVAPQASRLPTQAGAGVGAITRGLSRGSGGGGGGGMRPPATAVRAEAGAVGTSVQEEGAPHRPPGGAVLTHHALSPCAPPEGSGTEQPAAVASSSPAAPHRSESPDSPRGRVSANQGGGGSESPRVAGPHLLLGGGASPAGSGKRGPRGGAGGCLVRDSMDAMLHLASGKRVRACIRAVSVCVCARVWGGGS